MPRQHRRKTNRFINEDYMQSAVADICNGLETPSTAARKYGLKRTTIIYRVERKQKMDLARRIKFEEKPTPQPLLSEIFSEKQEKELMEFLNLYTYLPYDTSSSYKAARQLVYQFVKSHDIKHPKMWDIEQQAGVEWLKGFIQRNPQTNLRKPGSAPPKDQADADAADEIVVETKDIPFEAQSNKTENNESPQVELPMDSIYNNATVQSLESDISPNYSFTHFMDSSTPPQQPHTVQPDSLGDNTTPEPDPECSIIFPMVSIKQESEESVSERTKRKDRSTSREDCSKLDVTPADDDVFNSFGRNIAFQVKELYSINRLDAYELMHEVQTTVNKRLTNKLRLMSRTQGSIRTSTLLLPRVIKIDDDEDL